MKIKTKIIGIGLALMLIVSVVAMAVPAVSAAPPGDTQWIAQSVAYAAGAVVANGTDIHDISQSVDGRVWISGPYLIVLYSGLDTSATSPWVDAFASLYLVMFPPN
jgi:hypothetical protein